MRVLIEAGADVNKAMMVDCTTPLFMAAQKGDETMVRVLIQAGADVSKATDGGVTPLFTAAQNVQETVVRALIGGRGCQQGG